MTIFKKIPLWIVAVVSLVSCAKEMDSVDMPSELCEVGFSMHNDATRTAIDPDGITTRWAEGDKLAVWAKDTDDNYAFKNETFTLRYFSGEFKKAYFTSEIATMAEGDYTYMLSYPLPASVSGTNVTYSLPSEQNGKYDGSYDIMIAEPVVASELTSTKEPVELNTVMHHQMHALKITIPNKETNFEKSRVYSIEIIFPKAVVGDITLDVANPNAEPTYSNTSNKITVKSDEGFAVGSDIWVFVLPGMVSGDVSYQITGLEQRSEVATCPFESEMQRAHVTPIRMAMPPFEKYTVLNFSIGENNLGEDFNFFTLYDNDGNEIRVFNRNVENRYSVEYYGEFDANNFSNTNWTLVFDSDNAVVENSVNLGPIKAYFQQNITPVDVPYLLFQDFENVTESESYGNNKYASDDRDQPGKALSGTLAGWNAARYWLKPGAMRINSRYQSVKIFMSFASYHYGRLDTPALGGERGIKPGKSVDVKIDFDAAMYKHKSSSLSLNNGAINIATHTNANNPIDGIPTGSNSITGTYDTTLADFGTTYHTQNLADNAGDDDFGQKFPTYTAEITASSDKRIVFYPTLSTASGTGNTEVNVYIDNIRVSIAK